MNSLWGKKHIVMVDRWKLLAIISQAHPAFCKSGGAQAHRKKALKFVPQSQQALFHGVKFWIGPGKTELYSPGWSFSGLNMNGTIRATLINLSRHSFTHLCIHAANPPQSGVFGEPHSIGFSLISSCQEFTALLIAWFFSPEVSKTLGERW